MFIYAKEVFKNSLKKDLAIKDTEEFENSLKNKQLYNYDVEVRRLQQENLNLRNQINYYKQIESTAQKQLTEMLPEDFREEFNSIYNPDELTERLIKAADKISALIKCIEEINMGNKEFETAKESISLAIENMACPEAEVFLCEFIPSFTLSLDEQREIK